MKYNSFLFPATVVIEPANICNLHCKMCNAACSVNKNIKKEFITPEQLEIMLGKLGDYITNIVFQGDCEPLLNPYMPELVKVAAKYSDEVCLVSNGTLLDEKVGRILAENGLKLFSLSIDDHRAVQYAFIRIGASLEQVLDNLAGLIRMRRDEKPDIQILVHKVVFPEDTIESLEAYVHMFTAEYPVSKITFAPLIDASAQVAIKNWVLLRNQLENELIGKELNVNLRDYENYPYRTDHKYYCGTNLFFITHRGILKPCPLHSGSDKCFGNLLEESLEEISKKMVYSEYHDFWLRRSYNNKLPSMCEDCYILKSPYYYFCLDEGVNAINIFQST